MVSKSTGLDVTLKGHEAEDLEFVFRSLRHNVDRVTLRRANNNILAIMAASNLVYQHILALEESVNLQKSWECSIRNIIHSQYTFFRSNKGNFSIHTYIKCSGL